MSAHSVDREKYNKAKSAAITWHSLLEETKDELALVKVELNKVKEANTELNTTLNKTLEKNGRLEEEIQRWKKLSETLPDSNTFDEIENENRAHLKTIKSLKKQLNETEEKYKDKISKLEREKLLYEGRIQQLEEARKDLQDRYCELKQDMREQRLTYMSGNKI